MRKLWLWMACQSIKLKSGSLFAVLSFNTHHFITFELLWEKQKDSYFQKKDKTWFVVEKWVSLEKRHKRKTNQLKKERGIQALATKITLFWFWMLKVIAKIAGWAEVNDNQHSFEISFSCLNYLDIWNNMIIDIKMCLTQNFNSFFIFNATKIRKSKIINHVINYLEKTI